MLAMASWPQLSVDDPPISKAALELRRRTGE